MPSIIEIVMMLAIVISAVYGYLNHQVLLAATTTAPATTTTTTA